MLQIFLLHFFVYPISMFLKFRGTVKQEYQADVPGKFEMSILRFMMSDV